MALARLSGRAAGWCAGVIAMALVCGCGGATTPLETGAPGAAPGKGRAVFYASMPFASCHSMLIEFTRLSGAAYERAGFSIINKGIIGRTTLASVDLSPGEYHVFSGTCSGDDPRPVSIMAAHEGGGLFETLTRRGSLGSFTVGAGEIVDIGNLTFLGLDRPKGQANGIILVEATEASRLEALKSDPSLATRLVTRPLKSAVTAADLQEIEQRMSNAGYNGRWNEMARQLLIPAVRSARERLQSGQG